MKIIIANDYEDMSRKAANYLSAQVIMKPDAVLGLATGETPIGTYKQLVEWYNNGDIDFSQTSTINLDEYKGLTDPNSESSPSPIRPKESACCPAFSLLPFAFGTCPQLDKPP